MAFTTLATGATSLAAANWADTIGFANSAELRIVEGSQTISSGLDQSGLGTGVARFHVGPAFFGSIGSATAGPARFDCDVSPGIIQYSASGGAMYYRANGGNNVATRIIQDGSGSLYLQGGTITTLEVQNGSTYINDQCVPATLYQYGGTVTVDAGGTALTNVEVHGGTLYLYRNFTGTLKVSGPNSKVVFLAASGTPGTVTIDGGGTFDLRAGSIATMTGNSGRLILANATTDITIGGTAFVVGSRFTYDRQAKAATITFSNVSYRGGVGTGPTGYGSASVL
jgi:hypothetical protein